MKVLVVLAVISCCRGAILLAARNPDDVGAAVTFNNQDGRGTYDFGYSEGHLSGASFRRESGDAFGNKVGSFGLRDADGRLRIVRYVADENGFRADVTSNEPGVAAADPASATINKPAIVPAPVVPVAPVVAPPPPPPPPAFYAPPPPPPVVRPLPPPPPPQYNLVVPDPAPVAYPPPPPPAAFYNYPPPPPPPRPVAPVFAAPAPAPVFAAPAPVLAPPSPVFAQPAPVAKGFSNFAVPPPPPPPPAYYNNLVQGKGYVGAVRAPSLIPPFAAVPPQFGYLASKPTYQALGYPL